MYDIGSQNTAPFISQDASANLSSQYIPAQNRTSVSAQVISASQNHINLAVFAIYWGFQRQIWWWISYGQYVHSYNGHLRFRFEAFSRRKSYNYLGILILPSSIGSSGLIWGIIQLFFCSWISYYSLMTMVGFRQIKVSTNRWYVQKKQKLVLTRN